MAWLKYLCRWFSYTWNEFSLGLVAGIVLGSTFLIFILSALT